MPKRTWKSFSITAGGTPQPLVGTLTTAALIANTAPQNIPVSDSSMFRTSDHLYLDVGAKAERIRVLSVPDATHVNGVVTLVHATSAPVALFIPFCALYVQTLPGNTAALVFFYPDQQFSAARVAPNKTGLIKAFYQAEPVTAPTPPVELSSANNYGANPDNLAFYWIDGNTGDGYLPSIDQT